MDILQTTAPSFIVAPSLGGAGLLAPRGVAASADLLAVSDTGQNRVFVWLGFQYGEHREPDIVLGQEQQSATGRNRGASVSAASLQYPSGIWTDGKRLIVADAWNHRVLIWHSLTGRHGQPADVVVGQPTFENNEPNVSGLSAYPSAQSLYWPYGVCSDGISLWIADTGNRRVLFFERIPMENFQAADRVVGQISFEEREYDPQNAIWPYSVKISTDGALSITDTQYYRVLLWKDRERAFNHAADCILGQPDFEGNGQNQYRLGPANNTLNWCYDSCFFQQGIWVADTGNSRLLNWANWPLTHNAPADRLIGQPDFEINGESSLHMAGRQNNAMYWPFAISTYEHWLIAADTGNHRILFYQLAL